MTPLDVMWVGLGGGLGSVLRWWVGRIVGERYTGVFPLGTFRSTSRAAWPSVTCQSCSMWTGTFRFIFLEAANQVATMEVITPKVPSDTVTRPRESI